MDANYLDLLNPQQQDAVTYLDGPELVIAGAGSGKTRVLTYKIVHLLAHGYEPWRVMALTFTNKAAREMRERIEALVGPKVSSRLWMGTFHSIFSKILRTNAERIGFKRDFTIYDTSDSKSLIKSIIKEMDLDDKVYKPSVVMSAISTAKNALVSPKAYAASKDVIEADRRAKRPLLYQIYATYHHRCFVSGAMDFDDLLYYTNVLLRDNPDLLHHYQEYFRYILVDEYQDTNFAQHLIVSQLCEGSRNLCVVGDDAQSIYSFRGANIRNILNLRKAYPDLQTFKLEQNYRSTQNIVNAANSLITKNMEQIKKEVFSKNDVGSPIEVVQSYSDYEESFLIANRIAQVKMQTRDSYDEFAILYRTNAQSRILEESLRKRNIPYRIYGGLSFYQRKEIKDAIAYFRLAINPNDDEALRRVINYPSRGIGETTINKVNRAAIDHRVSMWEVLLNPEKYELNVNKGTLKKTDGFVELISEFIEKNNRGENAEVMAKEIIAKTALLSSLMHDRTPESISKQENLQELLSGVNSFVTGKQEEEGDDAGITLTDFLGEVSLATDQDNSDDTNEEKVTLMTVHAAKGLEFSNVFIVGVEEELFPSAMAQTMQEVEEERRLLYVAITRAKNFCLISYASSRFRNGQTKACSPSRFLREIDKRYLRLTTGSQIGGTQGMTNPVEKYRQSYHSSSSPRQSYGREDYSEKVVPSRTVFVKPSSSPVNFNNQTGSDKYAIHTLNEVSEGMIIEHPRFGEGEIVNIDSSRADAKIVVNFKTEGQKILLLKFAKFNII
jgi:DNA helicase-2/ATP-dependent DNA helicase PcrA